MAYYVSLSPFSAEKNDQLWREIFQGIFINKLKNEETASNAELADLDKNPDIIRNTALQAREATLDSRHDYISRLKTDIEELRAAIADKDDDQVAELVGQIDSELSDYYVDIGYGDPRYPFHVIFSELFKNILGLDIEKDYQDTLSLMPTDKWIELFKNIDAESVKKAITATEDDPADPEVISYYFGLVRKIRDIVRYCVDNKCEIKVSDELFLSENEPGENSRTKEIIEKFIKSK